LESKEQVPKNESTKNHSIITDVNHWENMDNQRDFFITLASQSHAFQT